MSDRTLTRILENISHVLGKRSKLMSQPTTQHENLSKFLSSHDHLKWLHDIERQSFYQVCLIFAHECIQFLRSWVSVEKVLYSRDGRS